MGNCGVGRCQGKEMGQAQEYGRYMYSQLEVRRKLDGHVMPSVGVHVVIHCV